MLAIKSGEGKKKLQMKIWLQHTWQAAKEPNKIALWGIEP
jgi:hypothetical protein